MSVKGRLIMFDLDGTLVEHRQAVVDFSDPLQLAVCEPKSWVVTRALQLREQGAMLAVLTGRTLDTWEVTANQVNALLPGAPVLHQNKWAGWDALREYKARMLRTFSVAFYVGDTDLDRQACQDAGVAFVHVDDFVDGQPVPGVAA